MLIFELFTILLFGGISGVAAMQRQGALNDAGKLQHIMALSGLNVKDGKQTYTTRLVKKKRYAWGWEYKFSIPDGRSFKDYLNKFDVLQDGINNRRRILTWHDLKQFNLKKLLTHKLGEQKEIELDFDGLLIIRVYDKPLPKLIEFVPGEQWKVPIGMKRGGNSFIFHDFEKIPHLILGGATTYGKSNFINHTLVNLIQENSENLKLHLVDLKGGVELCDYENIRQTVSIAYEPEQALTTLQNAYESLEQVRTYVRSLGMKNVQQAGIQERHFVVIDEVGELNPNEAITTEEKKLKQQCQHYMSKIARLGASFGFRLIVATQYPVGDVVNRQVKQNADAKLVFRVQSETASRVVLDSSGAEKLPMIKGRAIYQTADMREVVQTPLIRSDKIQEVLSEQRSEPNETIREGRENSITFEGL